MQSLLKQIADEISTPDEPVARHHEMRKETARKYAEITPEEREAYRQKQAQAKTK